MTEFTPEREREEVARIVSAGMVCVRDRMHGGGFSVWVPAFLKGTSEVFESEEDAVEALDRIRTDAILSAYKERGEELERALGALRIADAILAAIPSGSGWRPASTAPKDGSWILGMNNRGNPAVVIWSETATDRGRIIPGWIHPFSTGERSDFWNGGCGSELEFWKPIDWHPESKTKPYWAPPTPTGEGRDDG